MQSIVLYFNYFQFDTEYERNFGVKTFSSLKSNIRYNSTVSHHFNFTFKSLSQLYFGVIVVYTCHFFYFLPFHFYFFSTILFSTFAIKCRNSDRAHICFVICVSVIQFLFFLRNDCGSQILE